MLEKCIIRFWFDRREPIEFAAELTAEEAAAVRNCGSDIELETGSDIMRGRIRYISRGGRPPDRGDDAQGPVF